jgi:hypothetical protein
LAHRPVALQTTGLFACIAITQIDTVATEPSAPIGAPKIDGLRLVTGPEAISVPIRTFFIWTQAQALRGSIELHPEKRRPQYSETDHRHCCEKQLNPIHGK